DLDFVAAGGGPTLFTPRDDTDSSGMYSVVVDSGTWDITYSPPGGTGLAPRWRRDVAISSSTSLPDTLLLPLTVPQVTSIAPGSGTTAGGQSVTLQGTGFQPDAQLQLGGVSAFAISVSSDTTLTAVTPAHPSGLASVMVVNPGNQAGTLASTYSFQEPSSPI